MLPSLPIFPIKLRFKLLQQSLPIKLRGKHNHIEALMRSKSFLNVISGSATPPHQDCNIGEQIDINAPTVGAFTAQCSICFKWRFLPSREKYEEIREQILEQPFVCEAAREWRPEISCSDDPDITQDGSRLWAIDRPNIARPPLGWERLLSIRRSGGTRFADVYYFTPSGVKLRSMKGVRSYLLQHPDETEGVTLYQFSFCIPRPLDNIVTFPEAYGSPLVLALSHSSQAPQDLHRRHRMP